VTAAGRAGGPGAAVLPGEGAGQGRRGVGAGVAVLARGRAGPGEVVVDGAAGRGAAGHWAEGDPEIIIAADAGYNATRLAVLLAGLPAIVVARVRASRGDPQPSGRILFEDFRRVTLARR
jgi:hypothetical protein